jgi:predicted phage terminase large subunit-like protein
MTGSNYVVRRAPDLKRSDYPNIVRSLLAMPAEEAHSYARELAKTDLFFLGVYVMNRPDADNDWVFARCREVQADPNGRLDLWAREHFKSTIITHWLTVQDILNDPEMTLGIFSHTRPIAKAFLRQIKLEFERNDWLKSLFPDVLYANPRKESPKWSEDEGIVVRRKGNPKESTVEAWGLVDGQPTSKHYTVLLYDDMVTIESVTTPEMIAKVTGAWEISTNLGTMGGIRRFVGTIYHFADTYKALMKKQAAVPRVYAATVDGKVEGDPVLLSPEALAQKRKDMGPYVFGCQMLLDPTADATQNFKREWLRHYGSTDDRGMVKALLVDPASAKKKGSDYTAAGVLGLSRDGNIYVLELLRDRLNLTQRTDMLMSLHRQWKPYKTGYEKYGKDSDIEHIRSEMEHREYRFEVTEVGGPQPKEDRIKRLVPYFEQGKIYLPDRLIRRNYEGKNYDAVEAFIEDEYAAFPVCLHDDMLDMMARLFDLFPEGLPWPDRLADTGQRQASTSYDPYHFANTGEPSQRREFQVFGGEYKDDAATWAAQTERRSSQDTAGSDYKPW